ncbi:hypothetical protein KC921_03295 [Candidatus Woesebacteria bacterium]|nr:hypothetical protein [Candidatus Woesebacteria bacterium]
MHKETVIAVAIGLLFGLCVTIAVYKLQSIGKPDDAESSFAAQIEPTTTETQTAAGHFMIDSPNDGLITANEEITISGTADPLSYIVLFINDSQEIFQADDAGIFSFPLTLKEGANFFSLVAANQEGESYSENRVVVYEPEIPTEDTIDSTGG